MLSRIKASVATAGMFAASQVQTAAANLGNQFSATGAMDMVRSLHHLSGQTGPDASTAYSSSTAEAEGCSTNSSGLSTKDVVAITIVSIVGVLITGAAAWAYCLSRRKVNQDNIQDRLIEGDPETTNSGPTV